MNEKTESPVAPAPHNERHPTRAMLLMMIWAAIVYPGWIVGSFVAAGTIAWAHGWSFYAALLCALVLHRSYVARRNPELRQHRKDIGAGTKRWDMVWNLLFWPLMAAIAIVAGLDFRFGWAPMPLWLWPLGLLLLASGFAISAWAMSVNPFFEGTVRIQKERGQHVVEAGPYRRVRHPGYVGLCLWALASPFLLGSWIALIPAGVVVCWIVLRTALEDLTLRRELPGYADFAGRVRFRLLPGLW
jgi:protein-S-isoprenylcysteine O-methyltransferase Ste14